MKRPLNPLTRRLLNKQDWGKVLLELEAATIRLLQVTGRLDRLPRYLEPRDIAFKAIASLYTQERTWDPEKHPNVGKFLLYSIVRSDLNHLFESKDTELVSGLQDLSVVQDEYDTDSCVGVEFSQGETSSFEESFHVQDLVDKVMSSLSGDKIAQEVFQLKLLGCKDAEMSQRLELSVGDIRAASKRITRIGKKLLPKER